jgi:sterol 3beta-glucosyltransferase
MLQIIKMICGVLVHVRQVGTRGDVQPFLALGSLLVQQGHRVRLATHAMYRGMVQGSGLEFYPLGGDPVKLSAYMVKTST